MTVRLGVDTGGTFTDVVCYDESAGRIFTEKVPSTPAAFESGVLAGIDRVLEAGEVEPSSVSFLCPGTTVGTNTILERRFSRLGLLTNEGLRDVLAIGDQTRPELYDLQAEKPPELIPRRRRLEVPGRIDSNGDEVDPLDEAAVMDAINSLVEMDVETVVVSLLFSYLNPAHERRVGELLDDHKADLRWTLSSTVHPEVPEYDRTVTTVLNEAVRAAPADYLDRLATRVDDRGIGAGLNVIHSGGGFMTAAEAGANAIRMVLSGPAAGAVAARAASANAGYTNAIGIDMGGTSTDVSLIRDGELVRTNEGEINGLPIRTPMIDVCTVGAGGGSIVGLDPGGLLKVGPASAVADLGPACYGRGGSDPTITAANLVLGRLNPDRFLDGQFDVSKAEAREAIKTRVAAPLDVSVETAALCILRVANARIARNIHTVTVKRGDDPDAFVLVGSGGAGPLHAASVARRLGVTEVLIPSAPGVFSARGLLVADFRGNRFGRRRHGVGPDGNPPT